MKRPREAARSERPVTARLKGRERLPADLSVDPAAEGLGEQGGSQEMAPLAPTAPSPPDKAEKPAPASRSSLHVPREGRRRKYQTWLF